MLKILSLISAFSAFGLASGCSVYPTTKDVTGLNSTDIIQLIRCDTSFAVRQNAIDWIRDNGGSGVYPGYTGQSLAYALQTGRFPFEQLRYKLLNKPAAAALQYYSQAKVGYDFTLDVTEQNTQSAGIGGTRSFSRRVDTVMGFGENQLSRQVSRNFRLQDDFKELSANRFNYTCTGPRSENIQYPVAGSLPIYDLVRNFIYANETNHLQGDEKSPAIPKMADTITFTTKVTANFDPISALNPVGASLLLSTATFKFDNMRTDKHSVIITITVPPRKLTGFRNGVPIKNEPSVETAQTAVDKALNEQRERNVQNAIVQIGNQLNRLPF